MNINCVIVEDLQVASDYIQKCCDKSGIITVASRFSNVADALVFLNKNSIDLIFLDVEMPGANGFDLLDQLVYKPAVILTTSKPEYAYDAFEYNVTDFLKKPFTYQRFTEAIAKVDRATGSRPAGNDHIFIKCEGKLVRLKNDDILYIESMGDYVKFVTPAKKYISHNTIKSLEERVDKARFMKVHRSYIINILKIDDIRENDLFIMGNEIPISKSHKPEVLKRLNII